MNLRGERQLMSVVWMKKMKLYRRSRSRSEEKGNVEVLKKKKKKREKSSPGVEGMGTMGFGPDPLANRPRQTETHSIMAQSTGPNVLPQPDMRHDAWVQPLLVGYHL